MIYSPIQRKETAANDLKVKGAYDSYEKLIYSLSEKEIPENVNKVIEIEINEVNNFEGTNGELFIFIKKSQVTLLSVLKDELKIVAINHYRNHWMVLGLTVFGMPFGIIMSLLLGNFGYIGIGLAIGIPIGMAFGKQLDNKAAQEGRQLSFER